MNRRCSVGSVVASAVAALALPQQVQAQCDDRLHSWHGTSDGDYFGDSVSNAGDVNGDGFEDVIVGAPQDSQNWPQSGSARVYSGADGAMLHEWQGENKYDLFGASVSGAEDVDGDGFDDVIVGARGRSSTGEMTGSAYVYSGATGAVLYTWSGESALDQFGASVSATGDLNGDGFGDLVVGAPGHEGAGAAYVLSGATGEILSVVRGDNTGDDHGASVSSVQDVNGDGLNEILIGAPGADIEHRDSGGAYLYSGATGALLHRWSEPYDDRMGLSVSGAGDVDGDGFGDVIVGTSDSDDDSGAALVYSGLTGGVIHRWYGYSHGDRLGSSVRGAGDVDGDGYADVIVGASGEDYGGVQDAGRVYVHSGATGDLLRSWSGKNSGDRLGRSVSGAGDSDGDGFDDLIVGAPGNDQQGAGPGSAYLFSGGESPQLVRAWYGEYGFARSVSGTGDTNGDGYADLVVGSPWEDPVGTVYLFDGQTGEVLQRWRGYEDDQFGCSVSGAGDVNGDGVSDIIIGAKTDSTNGAISGSAYVFDGFTGSLIYRWRGEAERDYFGCSVAGAGDVNGDGFADLIVGASAEPFLSLNPGKAYVYSGSTGSLLYRWSGDSAHNHFGASVNGAGDMDGDGFDDLIVGGPRDDPGPAGVYTYSGATGELLFTWYDNDEQYSFGRSVSGAGDIDADGHDDIIFSQPEDVINGSELGSAFVASGATGEFIYTWHGTYRSDFGGSVSRAGDIDADGSDDVVVGAPYGERSGARGYISIFSGASGELLDTVHGHTTSDQFGIVVSGAGDVNGDGADEVIVADDLYSAYVFTFHCSTSLRVSGTCPGRMRAISTGNTPGEKVAFIYAFGEGSVVVPGGACDGIALGLNATATLLDVVRADADGDAALTGNAPSGACGRMFVQSLDLSSCATSNVVGL